MKTMNRFLLVVGSFSCGWLLCKYNRIFQLYLFRTLRSFGLGNLIPLLSHSFVDYRYCKSNEFSIDNLPKPSLNGVIGLVGNTPMIKLNSLSRLTGCTIMAKVEYFSPSGSSKDRFVLNCLENNLMNEQVLKNVVNSKNEDIDQISDSHNPTCISTTTAFNDNIRCKRVIEATTGSTGISFALLSKLKGLQCTIVMPSDIAAEKKQLIQLFGASLLSVKPASIVDPEMYVNVAKEEAVRNSSNTIYGNQFESDLNWKVHYSRTGPEIWYQTYGCIDAFVVGAGTGGTIAGVSRYLKERNANIQIIAADPQGSGIYNRIKHGTLYSSSEAEGTRSRHQVDSVVEGIGLNRLTSNFEHALIDDAIKVSDEEATEMSRYLLHHEGLFIGPSSAVHCAAAVKVAKQLGPNHMVVTELCDQGYKYLSKFWS